MNSYNLDLTFINDKDEITDNLWVGQHPHDQDVSEFKYIFCFNARPMYQIKNWQTVIVAPFDDTNTLPPAEFLHDLAEMVATFSKQGKTLVHCTAGINRSALVTGLALVKMGWSPEAAIKQLRSKRGKDLLCNQQFETWLLDQRVS